jgi:hypothetical protein
MKKFLSLPVLLLTSAILIYSLDMGLLIDQKAEAGNDSDSENIFFILRSGPHPVVFMGWGQKSLALFFRFPFNGLQLFRG